MIQYGLLGRTLKHSFSKKYFEEKFERESIKDCTYNLFEIATIEELPEMLNSKPQLRGFNVTIPYKEEVMQYLDALDESAENVGAVNVVKIENGQLIGYNSDYFGFKHSLETWIDPTVKNALVLGTGGASKAVEAALVDLDIHYIIVSREAKEGCFTYAQLNKIPAMFSTFRLIINTTPVGMFPNIDEAPSLPYDHASPEQYFYDLVYNPEMTLFMKKGLEKGAKAKNGLEMLHLQAEKAWQIWNSK